MQPKRFVNLNAVPTYIQDSSGGTITIHPFRECLEDRTRRPDAIYVLEGSFWTKYVSGTKAGPLHPFPEAKGFGRETFPALPIHFRDGRADDGNLRTDGSSVDGQAVQASRGRFRGFGDVLTPQGKIRRFNPTTGVEEEVDDVPENRNMGPQRSRTERQGDVLEALAALGIKTEEQFKNATDEQLLQIPGIHPNALPQLRENMRGFFAKLDETRAPVDDEVDEDEDESEDDSEDDGDEEDEESDDDARTSLRSVGKPVTPAPKLKPKPKVKKSGKHSGRR